MWGCHISLICVGNLTTSHLGKNTSTHLRMAVNIEERAVLVVERYFLLFITKLCVNWTGFVSSLRSDGRILAAVWTRLWRITALILISEPCFVSLVFHHSLSPSISCQQPVLIFTPPLKKVVITQSPNMVFHSKTRGALPNTAFAKRTTVNFAVTFSSRLHGPITNMTVWQTPEAQTSASYRNLVRLDNVQISIENCRNLDFALIKIFLSCIFVELFWGEIVSMDFKGHFD